MTYKVISQFSTFFDGTYKVIDNALEQNYFKEISDMMHSASMAWFYAEDVAYKETQEEHFYFTHTFYKQSDPQDPDKWEGTTSAVETLMPFIDSLNINQLIRIKANLYTKTSTLETHAPHVDLDYPHSGAILYINTNDGLTVLEDGAVQIESIANRLLLFDASKPHNSTSCTNQKCRININLNYL